MYRYLLLFIFFSCNNSHDLVLVKNYGQAQGTYYHIKYLSENGKDFKLEIDSILQNIDHSLSTYKPNTVISSINNAVSVKTDKYFNDVYSAARKVYYETNGSYDCTILPLVQYWGFHSNTIEQPNKIDSVEIKSLLKNTGFNYVRLSNDSIYMPKDFKLDFNSLAQGYSVDLIGLFFELVGVNNYLIEIGGEILAKGKNVNGNIWSVGVDKPQKKINIKDRFLFILALENKALATSGNYRKFYEKDGFKYSHTIDPKTGFPAQNRLLSVTVIHDKCIYADAYATAFMAMGVNKTKEFLINNKNIEVYLVYSDKHGNLKEYISPRMKLRII